MSTSHLQRIGPEQLESIFVATFVAEVRQLRGPCVVPDLLACERRALEIVAMVSGYIDWHMHLHAIAPMAMLSFPNDQRHTFMAPEWRSGNDSYKLTAEERAAIERLVDLRRRFSRSP